MSTNRSTPLALKSADVRMRRSRGSEEVQTGQTQPIIGIPCDVPLPKIVRRTEDIGVIVVAQSRNLPRNSASWSLARYGFRRDERMAKATIAQQPIVNMPTQPYQGIPANAAYTVFRNPLIARLLCQVLAGIRARSVLISVDFYSAGVGRGGTRNCEPIRR